MDCVTQSRLLFSPALGSGLPSLVVCEQSDQGCIVNTLGSAAKRIDCFKKPYRDYLSYLRYPSWSIGRIKRCCELFTLISMGCSITGVSRS